MDSQSGGGKGDGGAAVADRPSQDDPEQVALELALAETNEDRRHAPLDGGLLRVPPVGEEPLEDHLKRLAAAEEHQERDRHGRPLGKL